MNARASRFVALIERVRRPSLSLGANVHEAERVAAALLAAWQRPGRAYHGLAHLDACLAALDGAVAEGDRDAAELALWFHDAVYRPGQRGCEEASARWLEEEATRLSVPAARSALAAAAVRATAHGVALPEGPTAALVVDVDLSILGAPWEAFLRYDAAIAEEYLFVPSADFRRGRAAFLGRLLDAPGPLFHTPHFHEALEARARENLRALLALPAYASSDS